MFSISAVRSGIGGEGPRGPQSAVATTICAGKILFHILPLIILMGNCLRTDSNTTITGFGWDRRKLCNQHMKLLYVAYHKGLF